MIDAPAERLVEGPALEDRLAQRERCERGRVCALTADRVDLHVGVADGDRVRAVFEPRVGLAHGRHDRALEHAGGVDDAEVALVDALGDPRRIAPDVLQHEPVVRLRVLGVRRGRERRQVAVRHAFEQQHLEDALPREDRRVDDLSNRTEQGEDHMVRGAGVGDPPVDAARQQPRRRGERRATRDRRKDVPKRSAPRRHDEEVVPARKVGEAVHVDGPDLDAATASLEQFHQRGLVEAVVDREARPIEVPAEVKPRGVMRDLVPVALDVDAALVPQVRADLALARPGAMVVHHRVRQASTSHVVGRPLGVQRRLEPVCLEEQGKVQPGRARAHDADVAHG